MTFAKQPIASVGASDEAEICGNCFTFNADITGSEWAIGSWIGKDIISTGESFEQHPIKNYYVSAWWSDDKKFGEYIIETEKQ